MDKFWKWFTIAVTVFLAAFLLVVFRFENTGNGLMYRCRYSGTLYMMTSGKLTSLNSSSDLNNRISSLENELKATSEHLSAEREESKKLREKLSKFEARERCNELSAEITFEKIEPLYGVIDGDGNRRLVNEVELPSLKEGYNLTMEVTVGTQRHELFSGMNDYQINSILDGSSPFEIVYKVRCENKTYDVWETQIERFMNDFVLKKDVSVLEELSKRKPVSLNSRHPSSRFDCVRKNTWRKTK